MCGKKYLNLRLNCKMGKSKHRNNLTKDDILYFYEYLTEYADTLCLLFGQLNNKDSSIKKFQEENKLTLKSYSNCSDIKKANIRNDNYLVFEAHKPNGQDNNDIAFHILRHIRNSIAHALIKKEGKFFLINDKNKHGNDSCKGKIRCDLLPSLIREIVETKNRNTKN